MKRGIYKSYFKRLMDIVLSLIALILLSPVLLIVAIIIRVKLGSPVIFKHERPGLNGELFTMYKLRTMTDERDKDGNLLDKDLRQTKIGRIIRATSIDELPELVNVIKGDMSLIGPRPLLVEYLPRYNEHQMKRHEVKPGITGLAQVNGRNTISWEEKFDYDVEYVYNLNFLMDMKILMQTVVKVFKTQDVNQSEKTTMTKFMGTEMKSYEE